MCATCMNLEATTEAQLNWSEEVSKTLGITLKHFQLTAFARRRRFG